MKTMSLNNYVLLTRLLGSLNHIHDILIVDVHIECLETNLFSSYSLNLIEEI